MKKSERKTDKKNRDAIYLESAKKAMMGSKIHLSKINRLKKRNPALYQSLMEEARKEYAIAEKDYIDKLNETELEFYYSEPFGYNPRGQYPGHTTRLMIDFANILTLLNLPPQSKILEVGCGSAWISIFLSKMGYTVFAIDIAEDKIKIAREKACQYNTNIEFIVEDAERYTCNQQYDAIFFHDSLHHVLDERKVLQNCFNALNEGGKILLIEPGEKHSQSKLALDAVKQYGTIEKGCSRKRLKTILKEIGFQKVTCYTALNVLFDETIYQWIRNVARVLFSRFRRRGQTVILAQKR